MASPSSSLELLTNHFFQLQTPAWESQHSVAVLARWKSDYLCSQLRLGNPSYLAAQWAVAGASASAKYTAQHNETEFYVGLDSPKSFIRVATNEMTLCRAMVVRQLVSSCIGVALSDAHGCVVVQHRWPAADISAVVGSRVHIAICSRIPKLVDCLGAYMQFDRTGLHDFHIIATDIQSLPLCVQASIQGASAKMRIAERITLTGYLSRSKHLGAAVKVRLTDTFYFGIACWQSPVLKWGFRIEV